MEQKKELLAKLDETGAKLNAASALVAILSHELDKPNEAAAAGVDFEALAMIIADTLKSASDRLDLAFQAACI